MKTILTTMLFASLSITGHGQTTASASAARISQGQPFWRGKVMENEPVLFIRDEGKPAATGKLLFVPSAKPTVMAPDLGDPATTSTILTISATASMPMSFVKSFPHLFQKPARKQLYEPSPNAPSIPVRRQF